MTQLSHCHAPQYEVGVEKAEAAVETGALDMLLINGRVRVPVLVERVHGGGGGFDDILAFRAPGDC